MRTIVAVFIALFILLSLSAAAGQVTVESKASLFHRGFDNSREETATDVDEMLLPESSLRFTFPLTRQGSLFTLEYRLSSILESRFSFLLNRKLGSVDISGGPCLGFLNELPFEPVPGLAAGADIPIGKSLRVSLHGSTSLRMPSLFSLSGAH
jgi:hypothetical protein